MPPYPQSGIFSLLYRKYKILWVEDSEDDVLLFDATLRRTGLRESFEITQFSTGEQAIEYFTQPTPSNTPTWPDIVLLDIKLPGLSGLEILPAVRQQHPQAVLAMFTTSNMPEEKERAIELGADVFQTKTFEPADFSRFLQLLSELVEQRRPNGHAAE